MASSDSTETEVGTWYGESVLERLDRCRKFRYGQGTITATVNEAVKMSLEAARDLELEAAQDDLTRSVYAPEEDQPEPEDG